MKVVQVEDGFGIDVVRCPLADYFHSLELSELCDGTFANWIFARRNWRALNSRVPKHYPEATISAISDISISIMEKMIKQAK